jgi:dTDP-4-amino-4,6-dideoxygalactose transaminase
LIPQASPQRRFAQFKEEIAAAIEAVLEGGRYILGPAVESFEAAFAAYSGVAHAIGVASGTDAIALSLRALEIGRGDEVITPALTFSGTAQAILQTGALPRFVDVDPITRCMDIDAAAAAINERTAALLPVHLFGYPCDMRRLMALAQRHGLAVVEDCAQAHGASFEGRPLGSFGNAAAFSFYPTKNLGAIGDGGAVLTNDVGLAGQLRQLRNYAFYDEDRISQTLGFNSRLDEIQAAILTVLLPHLADSNTQRRSIAAEYRAALQTQDLGLPPDAEGCVYHQFAVTSAKRDALQLYLAKSGIGSAIHYAPGLHKHPAFAAQDHAPLPVTEQLAETLLSLPIQPEVAADNVKKIARAIRDFLRQ